MGANAGRRASPDWRTLYEAAVLELDPQKIPARIAEAQRAIMNHIEDVNRSDGSESERTYQSRLGEGLLLSLGELMRAVLAAPVL